MNTFVCVVITVCLTLGVGWLIWGQHKTPIKSIGTAYPPTKSSVIATTPRRPPNIPMPKEWQELRLVRETTLQSNPDLAAEYKSLLAEMDEQQKEMDAAMMKVDPKVAPIVAKLEQLRKRNSESHTVAN